MKRHGLAMTAAAVTALFPISLWVAIGITTQQDVWYYVLCGALSVEDVATAAANMKDKARYFLHHREELLRHDS